MGEAEAPPLARGEEGLGELPRARAGGRGPHMARCRAAARPGGSALRAHGVGVGAHGLCRKQPFLPSSEKAVALSDYGAGLAEAVGSGSVGRAGPWRCDPRS